MSRRSLVFLVCLVLVLLADKASAQDAQDTQGSIPNVLPPRDHGARTLRGHTYIEPSTQETPFITSHIGVRQGVSYFFLPGYPISAGQKTNLVLFALNERLDLQVRILPWLALWATGEAHLATGLDQESLFYGDSAFLGGGRGGAAVRIYRSRERGSQITARGYFGGAAGNELALPGFVQAVAVRGARELERAPSADPAQTEARLVRAINDLSNAMVSDTSLVQFGGSLHYAQTIVKMIGLQTSVSFDRSHITDNRFEPISQSRSVTNTGDMTVRFGVAPSVDAYHIGIPVALVLEYAVEKTYRSVSDTSVYVPSAHFAGLGLYYSGRTDLQLGVSAFARRNLKAQEGVALDGTRAETGVPTQLYGQFVLRYIWN